MIRALACIVGLVLAPIAASGQDQARFDGELDRWELAGGLEMGLYWTNGEGRASGSTLTGPRATNLNFILDGPNEVISDVDDNNDVFSGLLGLSLSLMSPGLVDVPSRPRVFLDVSFLPVLTQEVSVARSGDPGEFGLPDDIPRAQQFTGERLVFGSGTEITSQQQGFQLVAGLGLAMTADIAENRFRFKPSFQYSRTQNKVSAIANRAVRIVNSDPRDPSGRRFVRTLDSFRLLSLNDNFTEVYHAVGAALEIEQVTGYRVGGLYMNVFAKAAATYILGDRKTELFARNPDEPPETVSFRYKHDPWAYRTSVGVRIRWNPSSSRER